MAKKRKTYQVEIGDDFMKISEKLYGDPSFFGDLIEANPALDKLYPGLVITLPDEDPRVSRHRRWEGRRKGTDTQKPLEDDKEGEAERSQDQTAWLNDPATREKFERLFLDTDKSNEGSGS
jgi:hypothetical protein